MASGTFIAVFIVILAAFIVHRRRNDWTPWLLLSGGAVRALLSGRSASR